MTTDDGVHAAMTRCRTAIVLFALLSVCFACAPKPIRPVVRDEAQGRKFDQCEYLYSQCLGTPGPFGSSPHEANPGDWNGLPVSECNKRLKRCYERGAKESGRAATTPQPYAVARSATPVFNTPEIPAFYLVDGKRRQTLQDDCQIVKELETIAFPGTVFRVEEELKRGGMTVLKVTTEDYPYPSASGYYIDADGVAPMNARPPEREKRLPSKREVIEKMRGMVGSRYTWGGNLHGGLERERIRKYLDVAATDGKIVNRTRAA